MSTTLETALRDMLQERAGDIEAVPARLTHLDRGADFEPDEEVLVARPPRHSGWLLAAAVALIVAVAGAIIGIRQLGDHDTRPAAPNSTSPTTTPTATSPSPSPSRSPNAADVPLACQATLPQPWKDQLNSAVRAKNPAYGAQSASIADVGSSGELLIVRDFGRDKSRDVALVNGDHTVRSIFEVPDPDQLSVRNAFLDGDWVVVTLFNSPRPPKHTVSGSSANDLARIYVIDVSTGAQKEIASNTPQQRANAGRTIDDATELNGVVYWDVRPHYMSNDGVIKSYDLASGQTRTIFSGRVGYLVYSAAGLEADGKVIVHAPVPSPVKERLNPKYPLDVGTDGTSWAWLVSAGEIAWWTPGRSEPTQLRVAHGLTTPAFPNGWLIVSGHYVVIYDQLLDMRTGAVTHLGVPGHRSSINLGRPHLLLGSVEVGQGHWDSQGYWVDPHGQAIVLNTSSLPDLHC